MTLRISRFSFLLLSLALTAPVLAENHLALDFGLSITKSTLGISYTSDKNEISAGLKGFAFSNSGEYYLAPGISYNRYFTDNGWYGSLGYTPEYIVEDVMEIKTVSGVTIVDSHREKGWSLGQVKLGGGKNFQFTSWGVHLDAGVSIPLVEDATDAGIFIGIGGSYRFKLN